MGGVISTNSIITKHDKAVLKIKGVRDRISIYQQKAESCLVQEKDLAKQLLKNGKLERAKSLMRKSLATQEYLKATDFYLEQLEKAIYSLDITSMQQKVVEAMKIGNSALRVVENILAVENLDRILMDSGEGLQKQMEIEVVLKGVEVQEQFENNLEKELSNILSNPNPARHNLYKKGLKLKTISLPKSSSNIAESSPPIPPINLTKTEDGNLGRFKLITMMKGVMTNGK